MIRQALFLYLLCSPALANEPQPHCADAEEYANKMLATKVFLKARGIGGEEAAFWSSAVFGAPEVNQAIVATMADGGAVLIPCVWEGGMPRWSAELSSRVYRVKVDFGYLKNLKEPKTEIEEKKKGRR